MSYRVDIPTLSANEVYTLTFEYEGTETIQLIVGDLTLETIDRRVVFTTTSPVYYIESNVNLTNLNMYEGYYESDDFGGEYTQESYIEGKTLLNVKDKNSYNLADSWYVLAEMTEDGYKRVTQVPNDRDVSCFHNPHDNNLFANNLTGEKYTVILDVRKNTFPSDVVFEFCMCFSQTGSYEKLDDDIYAGQYGMYKKILGGENGRAEAVVYNTQLQQQLCVRYWGTLINVATQDGLPLTDTLQGRKDMDGCVIEYKVTVVEGDYYGQGIQPFHGIGCVKSPTIKSLSPENLYVSPLKYREPLRGFEYYHNDGTVEIYPNGSGAYSTIDLYTGKDVGLTFTGSHKTWYVNNGIKLGLGAGTYYFCCEIELVANKQITDFTGKPQIDVIYDEAQYFVVSGNFTETYDGEKYRYKGIFGASNKTVTDDIRGIYVGIWSYGISGVEKYIIRNITLTREASLKDICAISKSSIITTPDDLELYDVYYGGYNIVKQDKLDLTTGIVTRNVCKWKLNDYLSSNLNYWGFREWDKKDEGTNEYVRINVGALYNPYGRPTLARGWSEVYGLYFDYWESDYGASYLYDGKTYFYVTSGGVVLMCSKAQILSWTGVESYELLTKQHIYDWFIAGDFTMMNVLSEPTTEQLSLNALKSYRNGSIQTSSQQLAPTLKTTLPISNKFTTTNLTSGSTYNVYFDGTATKLDAGGTIITNPVSPCEVECGGTTLTIEGIDIQNVRVLETTVKNEVGSVCGTTDVELSRIKTKCKLYNYFDDIVISQNIATTTEIDYEVSKMIVTPTSNTVAYNVSQVIALSGTYKFHCKVKMKSLTDKYKFMFGNTNMNTNDVTPTSLVEEINLVTYINTNTQAYFYALYANNPVEYYDISLIKLSDEDITGTDTSSINYSQVISDLEQPIKLRSLGTTYDSYNPVTGELTKRIGVSETDGSYSVLSSPIVENIIMGKSVNLINTNFPITIDSTNYKDFYFDAQQGTEYTIEFDIGVVGKETECGICRVGTITGTDWVANGKRTYTLGTNKMVIATDTTNPTFFFRIRGENTVVNTLKIVKGNYGNSDIPTYTQVPQQLYTNGQVKVYSDSEVYPTTILNGQSTNNYEINELNKSSNYTIRYDGTCESINLANKSNEQGTNRIVKSGTNGRGNLTFVNNGGDIDNVLLVQNDVREQEINHFNGLQTVEVGRMLIENQRNMWSQDYIIDTTLTANYKRISKDYIKVVPNETLYCSTGQAWMDYSDIIQYNENKERVTSTQIFGWPTSGMYQDENNIYKNKVQLSEKTHYIRICMHNGIATTASVSRGDFLPPSTLAYNQYQGQYIDLPQPVQLNSLPDGTCDTYNPITGEYVQRVGRYDVASSNYTILNFFNREKAVELWLTVPNLNRGGSGSLISNNFYYDWYIRSRCNPFAFRIVNDTNIDFCLPLEYCTREKIIEWFKNNPTYIYYSINPITTQLTPINIPTFEGGILQLITTDGKVFPMVEYSMPTNNRYDTSSWETGAVYTQRNMTEAYFNESTTPMIPTETMTLTTDHISSGSIILNDNGNGLIVLKGNYTGRDIPYFTGMRSVEAIEVETTPSPDQPLFGKGGRK